MKLLIPALILFSSSFTYAQTNSAPTIPLCNDDLTVLPCRTSAEEAGALFTNMLIGNPEGYAMLRNPSNFQKRGISGGYEVEELRVVIMSQSPRVSGSREQTMTLRYEVIVDDSRGTDTSGGNYLFVATEVTRGDGFTYESKYTNTLEPYGPGNAKEFK